MAARISLLWWVIEISIPPVYINEVHCVPCCIFTCSTFYCVFTTDAYCSARLHLHKLGQTARGTVSVITIWPVMPWLYPTHAGSKPQGLEMSSKTIILFSVKRQDLRNLFPSELRRGVNKIWSGEKLEKSHKAHGNKLIFWPYTSYDFQPQYI